MGYIAGPAGHDGSRPYDRQRDEISFDEVERIAITHGGLVPVRPELVAGVKFFGRYRTGWIRDGVLLAVEPRA